MKSMFYSLDKILEYDAQYYVIFGERSNGKSYAVDKYVLDNYFTKGDEFVICKRYGDDMKSNICSSMLTPLYEYVKEKYNAYIRFYQGKWLTSDDETLPITQWNVMGYAQALSLVDKYKGSQYPKVTTIIFEEFMSMKGDYLPNEVNLLINLVSTIVRKRTNIKVFMLGNTITKYSPYSEALNIKLDKIKQGEIVEKVVKYKKSKTIFVIERTKNVKVKNNSNSEDVVFTNFGTNINKMINDGEFECNQYVRIVNGVYFRENYKELSKLLPVNEKMCFKANDRVPIIIEFNDNFYSVYINNKTNNFVVGIRQYDCKKSIIKNNIYIANKNKTYIVINGSVGYANGITVNNIRGYVGNERINNLLDVFVNAFNNNCIVYTSDEVGEDINTVFKICNLI